jgi:nucleotide-binding universal stress UspA family protein
VPGVAGPGGCELGTDGPLVIVVGVDGSPTSLHAAAYAAGLSRRQHARLVVVHVASGAGMADAVPGAAGAMAETRAQVVEELRQQVLDGARYVGVTAEFVVAHGDPFTELSRVATELRADAVVVGTSTQAGHRLVGSLAVRLVRSGRWPVTVVP